MNTSISTKEIWRIAVPIMIGNLAQTLITFTDTAFLGHLGVVALGASMMAGMFYFVFTTMAMGFAIGIQIIVARRFGERQYEKIGSIFQHVAFFIFLFGIILFTIYTYIVLGKKNYNLFKRHHFDKDMTFNIFRIAGPTMFQKLFTFSAWFIFFILIEKLGEEAIGVSSIVRSVYMIMFIPVFGFLSTSNTLTSRIIGAGHADEVMTVRFVVAPGSTSSNFTPSTFSISAVT